MRYNNFVRLYMGMAATLPAIVGGLFLSCAVPVGEDWIEERINVESVIGREAALDLAPYILRPEAGTTPLRSFTAPSFHGSIQWTADGEAATKFFQAGRVYKAGVTLYALEGYTFTGAAGFRYGDETLTLLSGGTNRQVMLEIGFSKTGSDVSWALDLDLADYIPAPKTGVTPVQSFMVSSSLGIVAWTDGEGNSVSGNFEAGKNYTAKVILYGYYTFPAQVNFRYDVNTLSSDWKTGEVTLMISFAMSGDGNWVVTPTEVQELYLIDYIPVPEAGAIPIRSFAESSCVGVVAWTDEEENPVREFQSDRSYTAVVTLYTKAGYTFSNSLQVAYVPLNVESSGVDLRISNRTSQEEVVVTLTFGQE